MDAACKTSSTFHEQVQSQKFKWTSMWLTCKLCRFGHSYMSRETSKIAFLFARLARKDWSGSALKVV